MNRVKPTPISLPYLFSSTSLLDCLLLLLASVEGIGDLSHDLGVGDPAIRSYGRYEVGEVGVEMELTAEAVARLFRLFLAFLVVLQLIGRL